MAERRPRVWLKRRRALLEMSQEALAAAVGVSVNTVQRWLSGEDTPQGTNRRRLAAAVGLSVDTVDRLLEQERKRPSDNGGYATMEPLALDSIVGAHGCPRCGSPLEGCDMHRRDFIIGGMLAALGMPEPIGLWFSEECCPLLEEGDVLTLSALCTGYLAKQDAQAGGGAVCDVAMGMLRRVQVWCRDVDVPSQVRGPLERFCGELGAWAGWLAFDAGRIQLAQRCLQDTILHARLVGDEMAELRAMDSLSSIQLNDFLDPRSSLQVANAGMRIAAERAPSTVSALFCMRAALGYAYLGDAAAFEHYVARGVDLLELNAQQAQAPDWIRWVTETKWQALTGVGYSALGQSAQAVEALEVVRERSNQSYRRDGLLDQIRLARALGQQGDTVQAGTIAMEILPDAFALQSSSIRRDFRRLRNFLSQQPALPQVTRDFIATYDDMVLCA